MVLKVNNTISVLPQPVGLPERIGNRVQIPNGTATVSKEAAAHGESRSLEQFREGGAAAYDLQVRISAEGWVVCLLCKYGSQAAFDAGKRLRQRSLLPQFFVLPVLHRSPFRQQIALRGNNFCVISSERRGVCPLPSFFVPRIFQLL